MDTLSAKVAGGASKAKAKGPAKSGADERQGPPNIIGPRVNLALPFSKISVQEPSQELIELTKLLSDLLVALADWLPEETLAELRARVEALATRLST